MLISNAAGAMLFGVIFNFIFGKDATAIAVVCSVAAAKFGELSFGFIISVLIKSVLCGFFVYIAVYLFGRAEGAAGKVLAVWIPIAAFVFLGLEHSIANMFYFAAGAADALNGIVLILIAVIGNSVGAIALDRAIRFMSAPDKK